MKISGLDFPSALIEALRNDELVVFAGAGVSMPMPANLPGFEDLAAAIAKGTGETRGGSEPVDRFLGRLGGAGVDVHTRAAEVLGDRDPLPSGLHRDLLRLYETPESVRVVTTNFDTLFEQAGPDLFDPPLHTATAPALPRGTAFNGIIHVHGALNHPDDIVLTDEDFGRAYLTEGWARRFLVDLFRSYAVLFVGYSHSDLVMTYLGRALPPDSRQRYVLTDDPDNDRWRLLGIEPIGYTKPTDNDHSSLEQGVQGLADHVRRGVLDWQRKVGEIASNPPSLDDEAEDLIGDALSDETRCRFFTDAAVHPDWIGWLERRGHLDGLFGSGAAEGCERLLARWVAREFALDRPSDLFALIARKGVQLNSALWHELVRTVAHGDPAPDAGTLAKWTVLLLAAAPPDADGYELLDLGERCAAVGLTDGVLAVFEAMTARSLVLEEVPWLEEEPLVTGRVTSRCEHWPLTRLYDASLKPILHQIAEPLLEMVAHRLTDEHRTLCAWQSADREWDSTSDGRSAMEPHEQDRVPEAIDVLIDAARDCLEHLALREPDAAARWTDNLVRAKPPLLRRLAVHTLTARRDLSADQKVDWLLSSIGLHDRAAHHELFQALRAVFPDTGRSHREAIVEAILAYEWSRPDDEDSQGFTAYRHFEWLHWLHESDPECDVVGEVLEDVKQANPDFQPREHPDLNYHISAGSYVPQSPWSADDLLLRAASDWLDDLLAFEGGGLREPNRKGLLAAVQEAASRDFDWGLALAGALAESSHWDADFWPALMRSWIAELDEGQHRRVLERLDSPGLFPHHVRAMAETLYALVRGGGFPHLPALLEEANQLAAGLWEYCESEKSAWDGDDWLNRAVNHPAGMLAEFWVQSLWLWRGKRDPAPEALGEDYAAALLRVVQSQELSGTCGKAVLARHLDFLLTADARWTVEHLIPIFRVDEGDDYRAVWSGLVYQGLTDRTAKALGTATLQAALSMDVLFPSAQLQKGFVNLFVGTITMFVDDPLDDWLPAFFDGADEGARRHFALDVGDLLRRASDTAKAELWARWLKRYWENRLRGVPAPLSDPEAAAMLYWLRGAGHLFLDMVDLAVRTPAGAFPAELFDAGGQDGSWLEYPESTGHLLVHLGGHAVPQPWQREDVEALIAGLLEVDLPSKLRDELQELRTRLAA